MKLPVVAAELTAEQVWTFSVDVATHATTDVAGRYHCQELRHFVLDAIDNLDELTHRLDAYQRAAVATFRHGPPGPQKSRDREASQAFAVQGWYELLAVAIRTVQGTNQPSASTPGEFALQHARNIGYTPTALWYPIARTFGASNVDLWASMADDWDGTTAELNVAVEAATAP